MPIEFIYKKFAPSLFAILHTNCSIECQMTEVHKIILLLKIFANWAF